MSVGSEVAFFHFSKTWYFIKVNWKDKTLFRNTKKSFHMVLHMVVGQF